MTMMGLQYLAHVETKRSNLAREGETFRHNVVTEDLGFQSLGETVRSNLARENIQQGNLDELVRSNYVREAQNEFAITENARANRMRESIQWSGLFEEKRANKARESISLSTLAETSRHNRVEEAVKKGSLAQLIDYQTRSLEKDYYKTALDNLSKTNPVAGSTSAQMKLNELYGVTGGQAAALTASTGVYTMLSDLTTPLLKFLKPGSGK